MFCGECGTQNPDNNQFCSNCGNPLKKGQPSETPAQPVVQAAVPSPAPVSPVASARPPAVTPSAPAGQATVPATAQAEKLLTVAGIGGFIIGLISLFLYPYLCGILAILLGATVVYKSENRRRKGVIIAGIGLILGLGTILVNLLYFTIFPPAAVTSLAFFWLV